MLPEERRRAILDHVRSSGSADVAGMSGRLRVSAATIRRDLRLLEERGDLERTHGGAVTPRLGTAYEPVYGDKLRRNAAAKSAIAARAATLVQDGEVVILDSGSTTLGLAEHLARRRNLTVVTSDLQIAVALAAGSSVEVIVIGGRVRSSLFSVIGPSAESDLRALNADVAFLGADGISLTAGVTNANLEEAAIKQRMLEAGQRAVLLADHTKFGKTNLAKVCDVDAFDEIITDEGIADEDLAPYRLRNPHIVRVPCEVERSPC